jgi:hypothetical protein
MFSQADLDRAVAAALAERERKQVNDVSDNGGQAASPSQAAPSSSARLVLPEDWLGKLQTLPELPAKSPMRKAMVKLMKCYTNLSMTLVSALSRKTAGVVTQTLVIQLMSRLIQENNPDFTRCIMDVVASSNGEVRLTRFRN